MTHAQRPILHVNDDWEAEVPRLDRAAMMETWIDNFVLFIFNQNVAET